MEQKLNCSKNVNKKENLPYLILIGLDKTHLKLIYDIFMNIQKLSTHVEKPVDGNECKDFCTYDTCTPLFRYKKHEEFNGKN